MKNLKQVLASLGLASFMLVGGNAVAQVALLPGVSINNTGTTFNIADNFSTGTFVTDATNTFAAASFSGSMYSAVYMNDTLSPYSSTSGALTFLYTFKLDAVQGWLDNVNRLTVNGFTSYKTSVAYDPSSPYTAVNSMDRSDSPGNTLGVSWAGVPGVAPGGYGQLIVYTDATSFSGNSAYLQDGSNTTVAVFAPVPEPETYAMLLAGLGLLGFMARRRKQKESAA